MTSLADDTVGPFGLLTGTASLAVAYYPDPTAKADLIARMTALAAPRPVHHVVRGEAALPFVDQSVLVLVDPGNPAAAVSFFNRNRDHFEGVNAKVLLLLMKGGSGEVAMMDAPALASFAREASFEVDSEPPRDEARAAFTARYALEPEEWLRQWRSGAIPDTIENNHVLSDALSLAAVEAP